MLLPASAKHFSALLSASGEGAITYPSTLKKGQTLVRTPVLRDDGTPSRVFMEEGVAAQRRDNPGVTACANCGSPHGLKACSGCKQRYYCSRSCQRVRGSDASPGLILKPRFRQANWAQGHKKECTGGKSR